MSQKTKNLPPLSVVVQKFSIIDGQVFNNDSQTFPNTVRGIKFSWNSTRYGISAGRLAFAIHHERWPNPELDIDHIDGNPQNQRKENLREVTHRENMQNKKRMKNNTTGHMGITLLGDTRRNKPYRVRINTDKGRLLVGDFKTLEEAIAARKEAEHTYGYHSNHGR